ncbi:hypothetical protein PAXRUDRAFT_806673 [Paxillus rubicundulus Ve08.2h10]|uniref:Uncharacterized protein n=1 Tax=Paxillus rubicundulus Ve08.2h10 TaxID=930991 RepID=A0A0D0DQU0_9AGAM|nr:hypothetical protein PAXRUDRAFT_806673 [Paxillus rubicundulus Ve08.2h10]
MWNWGLNGSSQPQKARVYTRQENFYCLFQVGWHRGNNMSLMDHTSSTPTWNSTGATPIDSDEPGEHIPARPMKKNQGFEISAFRYFGIYCPNMPRGCQTSPEMQWAVV